MESLNADLFQLILVVSLVPLLGFLFALMSGEITWPKKSFYVEDECRDGVNIRWEADAFFILNVQGQEAKQDYGRNLQTSRIGGTPFTMVIDNHRNVEENCFLAMGDHIS